MIRTVTIEGRTGLFSVPSFFISDNESLEIKFEFKDEIRRGRYRVVVRHGTLKKTFSFARTDTIELSADWLKKNAENVEFSLVMLNATETEVIKDDYQVEPLKLETLDGNFVFTAVVQSILDKQREMDEKLNEIISKLIDFEENGVPLVLEENE